MSYMQEDEFLLDCAYRAFRYVRSLLEAYPIATIEQIAPAFSRDCAYPYDLAYECVGLALQQVRGQSCLLGCEAGRPVCWYGLALFREANVLVASLPDKVWLGDYTPVQMAAFNGWQRVAEAYCVHIGTAFHASGDLNTTKPVTRGVLFTSCSSAFFAFCFSIIEKERFSMVSLSRSYGVMLSSYRRSNEATCLMPTIRDMVEAHSPQEAVYLVMERDSLMYVDSVEVALPDGSTLQWNRVLFRNAYDVALWRNTRKTELPIIDEPRQADSPLLAALSLMQQKNLTYVARVTVRCPDGSVWRKEHLKREKGEVL